jgi:serine/threonine protein kinase
MMMICPNCRTSNADTARFCSSCGADLGETTRRSEERFQQATLVDPVKDSLLDSTIAGRYRIDRKIGAGGMGTVYRATRLLIGDEVAVKILHAEQSDPKATERFRREAQAAARLKHPNAVTIHDFGVTDDCLQYLVMELVEGESLRQIIKQQGPLTPSASAEIVSQVCAALDEAHRHNIIHRDIKPDNIIVNVSATGLRVKVLDFGIAKLRDETAGNLTQTGSILGTPHYMSPEQCLGEELDGRSDIYSLGVVLYEMLTGLLPFNSPTTAAVVVQQVTQAPPPLRSLNASISPAVEAAVLLALEKQRDARPQTAAEFARNFSASIEKTAPPVSASARGVAVGASSGEPASRAGATTVVVPRLSGNRAFSSPTGQVSRSRSRSFPFAYVAVGVGALILCGILVAFLKSRAQEPVPAELLGRWHGEWSAPSGTIFSSDVSLEKAGNGNGVRGTINWTMRSTPQAVKQASVGLTAVEYVSGSYDPATRVLEMAGYKKDDPNNVILLDKYKLNLGAGGATLGGATWNQGKWTGRLSLTR